MGKYALIIVSIVILLPTIIYSMRTYFELNEQKEQNASLREENDNLQKKLQEKEDHLTEYSRHLAVAQRELASCNYGAGTKSQFESQGTLPKAAVDLAPKSQEPNLKAEKSSFDKIREQVIKDQVPYLYNDLLKELALPEGKSKKLSDHLAKTIKAEAEFGMKVMDPNISVDDLMRLQETLTEGFDADLRGILSPREQEMVRSYNGNLPKKMQNKHFMNMVEQWGLNDSDKERAKAVIERALDGMETKKNLGNFSKENILELREKFAGKKPGSPEFLKTTIDLGEAESQKLLKNLKELPPKQYESLKQQIEMPLGMMRQQLNLQETNSQSTKGSK